MLDFQRIAADLLAASETLLPSWLPAGKRRGAEYVCGSLSGDEGDSLSINVRTGLWADFATGEKGGDLLSLYAAIHGMKQGDAARALGYTNGAAAPPATVPATEETAITAPSDAPPPPPHRVHGEPHVLYAYRTESGALIGYVARWDTAEGKTFSPYRWTGEKWEAKAFMKPRPLYGLDLLAQSPNKRVLLVEGEKAADAARPVMPGFVVIAWPGGANAIEQVDWSPLRNRDVDLWPDADEPGRKAMSRIAEKLIKQGACHLRVIDPEGQSSGWDVADAVAAGMSGKEIIAWARRDGGKYIRDVTIASEPLPPAAVQPGASPALDERGGGGSPQQALDTKQKMGALLSVPSSTGQRWQILGIDPSVMSNGRPPANEDTVHRLCAYLDGVFWYDTFLMRVMTTFGDRDPQPVNDEILSELTIFFQRHLALPKMSLTTVKQGIAAYGGQHRRNCAQEWMHSLKWDEVARLEMLLPSALGTEDDEYHRAVGRCFVMGMVRRVMEPGCQMDHVLLLEGGEGNGKSSALRALGGEWFTEASELVTSKDFYQCLQGKMLVELSEMSSFDRVSIEKIKSVITNRVDTYRKSYGFLPGDYPRQCVFTCTTNRDDWNRSDTGARRFWRAKTGIIDVEWIEKNREQLFAEAVARLERGESHWDVPLSAAKALQDDAREGDPWEDAVLYYANARSEVRPDEVLRDALSKPLDMQDKGHIARVRSILRMNGYVSMSKWEHGKVVRVWRPMKVKLPAKREYEDVMQAEDGL
jgi:hypothetical protein